MCSRHYQNINTRKLLRDTINGSVYNDLSHYTNHYTKNKLKNIDIKSLQHNSSFDLEEVTEETINNNNIKTNNNIIITINEDYLVNRNDNNFERPTQDQNLMKITYNENDEEIIKNKKICKTKYYGCNIM